MAFIHEPVLLKEVLEWIQPVPGGVYCDGTLGGGGHSEAILQAAGPEARLFGIDLDEEAIAAATNRLSGYQGFTAIHGNFHEARELLRGHQAPPLDGVLLDLGVSSPQLDQAERGFSYHEDAPLDMRMSQSGETAADLVNTLEVGELSRILSLYGEEKYAYSIAKGIVRYRESKPIETTLELAEIVKENVPQKARRDGHPARKTFHKLVKKRSQPPDGT